ncbi:MAG: NusG domain II-containing protein [Clostridia bacterium]|nr:NusG domain II-containing protein [Clostridia bacterium]
MPRKKDIWLILAVLLAALVIFLLAKQMPQKSLEGRTADVTIAPDAIEVLEHTEKPDVSALQQPSDSQTPAPAVTKDTVTAEPAKTVPADQAAPAATARPAEAEDVRDVPTVTAEPAETTSETLTAPTVTPGAATAEPAETTPEVLDAPTVTPGAVTAEPEEAAATAAPETAKPVAGPVMGPVLERSQEPVKGHVIIMVQGQQYGDPIPMDMDKIITVRQDAHTINRIHITRESVHMESSTCENQDCVGQGMVTFENYRSRILGAYIVCLPNGVTVEMVPVSEPEGGQ